MDIPSSNRKTRISIIIPVYNCASFLDRCIETLLSQTIEEWEAIFINDGSIDNSAEIIESYVLRDSRINLINKPNGGAASARNKGLDVAHGEYITMIDADDTIPNNALEMMLNAATSTHCDLVIASQTVLREDGTSESKQFSSSGLLKTDPHFLFSSVYRGPVAKLYRKDIIDRYNLRMPEDAYIAEDYVFVTSYWTRTKSIYVINDSLYNYMYQENTNSLVHRFCDRRLPFDAYVKNAEAPWRTYKFLVAVETDNSVISDWIYELYKDLWRMSNNSMRYLKTAEERRELQSLVKCWDRDMSKYMSFFTRVRMLHRYPSLVRLLKKLREMYRKCFK